MKTIDIKATGRRIHMMVNEAGISKREIQDACGFTTINPIYKWVNGKSIPSIDHLVVLADLLGVTLDELLVCKEV